jgi:hypothetical protein
MPDWITSSWESTAWFFASVPYAAIAVWSLTGILLAVGLIGSVVPLLPGPFLILIAGILHTILRPESGMSWQGIVILSLWLVLAYVIDFFSGAIGARRFGASRWGIAGVVVGGIVGLFFAPLGFICSAPGSASYCACSSAWRWWPRCCSTRFGGRPPRGYFFRRSTRTPILLWIGLGESWPCIQ